jgi:hypothetical protein
MNPIGADDVHPAALGVRTVAEHMNHGNPTTSKASFYPLTQFRGAQSSRVGNQRYLITGPR